MAVMAGTGGLGGAIGGALLLLLGRAVMGLSAGIAEFMPPSVAFGALLAVTFGGFLMARQIVTFAWQPRLIPSPTVEQEQIPS